MAEIREPAEVKYKAELEALARSDSALKPPGWRLSPRAVETFVLGSTIPIDGTPITPKYIGERALVQVAIATLASDRALMLVGEPGTAKSFLSEHLAAAIGGTSNLIVQGTAGTSEEHLKYGWNYALLLAEGPSPRALVKSPIFRAMREGKLVRFEEITRVAPEVLDALISILSEKQVSIPELGSIEGAQRGFNVIATANTRDRGVNEMSSALKRRFNFVTVPVVRDLEQEIRIVKKREAELRQEHQVGAEPPEELARLLVTLFQELRAGVTKDGRTKLKPTSTVLSTGEAISVLYSSGILAQHFGSGTTTAAELAQGIVNTVQKDRPDDMGALADYCESVVRARTGPWGELYKAFKARIP